MLAARGGGPPPPKRLPGRPRLDGMQPVQRKAIAAIEGPEAVKVARKNAKLVARIRYLAGRRQTPDDITALILDEFQIRLAPEALKPGGLYYDDFRIGRAKVNLAVGETLVDKATTGKYVETMFWAKSEMGMAETAAGRAKVAQEKEEEIQGIDVAFDDEPTPIPIARGKKRAA